MGVEGAVMAMEMERVINVPTSTGPARQESKISGAHRYFCSQRKFLQIPAPLVPALKLVSESLSPIAQVLFKLLPPQ